MQFGKKQETEIIDEDGSTRTIENNFTAGIAAKPRRLRYEIRHRTDKTDLETLTQIAHGLLDDITKLDAGLKLERTKTGEMQGYYTIVECYTVLEY